MSDISRLAVVWVSAHQRHYHQSTRGIATPEQRLEWEREADEIIAAHDREVAAKALRDAAGCFGENQMIREGDVREWLRARADQIEEGSNDK